MIAWWRNSRLTTKLLVCGACFLAPIVVLLTIMSGSLKAALHLADLERSGISLLDPLEDASEFLPERLRLILGRMNGENVDVALAQVDKSLADRLNLLSTRMRAETGLLGLDAATLEARGLAHLQGGQFVKRFQEILATPAATPAQAQQVHAQAQDLIDQLRDYLGDSAELMLDPELASYYLVYLMVGDLPRSQDRLGRLYTSGYLALTTLPGAEIERAHLDQYALVWEESVVGRVRSKIAKAGVALSAEEMAPLQQNLTRYLESTKAFLAMARSLSTTGPGMVGAGKNSAVALAPAVTMEEYLRAGRIAQQEGADLWDRCNELFQVLLDKRNHSLRLQAGMAIGISLIAVAVSMVLAWAIVASITRPLARVAQIAGRIAQGEVAEASAMLRESCPSARLGTLGLVEARESDSEIIQLYAAVAGMIRGLDELLHAVDASGGSIESSAQRIAASARQLEAAATQQAASTTEVGATSREISSTAGGLADTMSQVLGVANRSSELAQEGREGLARMGTAMEDLSQASRDMTAKLSDIREKTSGIGQFLSTIAKVANQTNLLSLNAAIEAEKAGEFGPGFSVVAREIRRLADQTAGAALDIERTIREMQASVQTGVTAMDGFAAKTAEASQTTKAVGSKLARIIAAGEELAPRFSAVSQGSRLQAEGADQISEVISQLAQGAGQTRDSLAEFRQAAEELTGTASGLRTILGYFKLGA